MSLEESLNQLLDKIKGLQTKLPKLDFDDPTVIPEIQEDLLDIGGLVKCWGLYGWATEFAKAHELSDRGELTADSQESFLGKLSILLDELSADIRDISQLRGAVRQNVITTKMHFAARPCPECNQKVFALESERLMASDLFFKQKRPQPILVCTNCYWIEQQEIF